MHEFRDLVLEANSSSTVLRCQAHWQKPNDWHAVYSERKRSAIAISPGGVLEIERCQPTAARRSACFAAEGTREGEAGREPVA